MISWSSSNLLPEACDRKMATYGYARVSTALQARDGDSLPAQERKIAGHALILGVTVDRIFVERGVSGSKPLGDRPEGAKLLAILKPGDNIITTKLDRMFRSAADALTVHDALKARGVSLHMIDLGGDVTGNGISKLVFTILSAVAEVERDRTRERVLDIIADKRKRGVHVGGQRPTGYSIGEDGKLVPNKAEQQAITRMVKLRAGGLSWRDIAAKVSESGVVVSHETVRRLVTAATESKRVRERLQHAR
jgi:putative DNA-invertase from lambdoid prophage Rac